MKPRTRASLKIEPDLRSAAEEVLEPGETLSRFAEQSIRDAIRRRQAQRAVVTRGPTSTIKGRKARDCVPASQVLSRLEGMLKKAKRSATNK